jgi:hypothetical protein
LKKLPSLSAPRHLAHSIVFKFFTADWLLFGVARMAVVTLQFVEEDDRHFEHSPFNLPTKAQPSAP